MNCGMTVQHEMQPFQGCLGSFPLPRVAADSQPWRLIQSLWIERGALRRRPIFNFQFSIFQSQFRPESQSWVHI